MSEARVESGPIEAAVARAVAAYGGQPGPVLLVVQAVAADLGHVPTEAISHIARALNVSRAEVHGVITFYGDLHTEPRGRHLVQLCRAEACQAVGANSLVEAVTQTTGVSLGETSTDGDYTLEGVFCLGNCALGPAAAIDGRMLGRVTAAGLVARLAELKERS